MDSRAIVQPSDVQRRIWEESLRSLANGTYGNQKANGTAQYRAALAQGRGAMGGGGPAVANGLDYLTAQQGQVQAQDMMRGIASNADRVFWQRDQEIERDNLRQAIYAQRLQDLANWEERNAGAMKKVAGTALAVASGFGAPAVLGAAGMAMGGPAVMPGMFAGESQADILKKMMEARRKRAATSGATPSEAGAGDDYDWMGMP